MGLDERYKALLERRIPRDQVAIGRAYVIHARNGGVGVALMEDGKLGYNLRREKFGAHYLFVEYDWADDPNYGTVIPLRLIETEPPTNELSLLGWLRAQEDEHRAEIDGAWDTVLRRPTRKE